MSHFTVLVIGPNPEQQLAPFQENNMGDCPREYMEFTDVEDQLRKNWEADTAERVRMPDGSLKTKYDNEFRVPGEFGIGTDTHKVPDHLPIVEIPVKQLFPSFDDYATDYEGYRKDAELGRYGYWENPNRKWDWYSLGGRWTGFFKLKAGAIASIGEPGLLTPDPEDGYGDQCLKSEIDFEGMRSAAAEEAGKRSEGMALLVGYISRRILDHQRAIHESRRR